MTVDKKVLQKWKLLSDFGDIKDIAEFAGVSKPTVSKALKTGDCKETLFIKITEFYEQRETRLQLV